ncbi:hypothetical protein [Peribacillus muralis]|uniref:hypothetical protein n=1 Tax=Peribacillus muralis TaxID=264697 RepID=UPI0036712FD1
MNKTISFSISYKSLLILIGFIIVTLILLFQIIPTLITYLKDEGDNQINAIVSTAGNITGGLIGGIVAYIVAAYQVSKAKEQSDLTSLKQSYINLKLLSDEVEFNGTVFKAIQNTVEIQAKAAYLEKQLVNDQWNKISPSFADHLTSEDFKDICKLYRNISLIKSNPANLKDPFIVQTNGLVEKLKVRINIKLEEMLLKVK